MPEHLEWNALNQRQGLIWAAERLHPEERRFDLVLTIQPSRSIDAARLKRAWDRTVAGHQLFRTVIDNKEPRWRLAETVYGPVETPALEEGDLEKALAAFAAGAIDPARPLWELRFFNDSAGLARIGFRAHALLLDARSMEAIVREVDRRYADEGFEAAADIGTAAIPDPTDADEEEWRRILADPPPAAALPGCETIAAATAKASVHARIPISENAGQNEDIDAAVSAATFAWLYRLSGQQDIIVAAPIGPRDTRAYLRATIEEGETYASLLAKVKKSRSVALARPLASIGHEAESAYLGELPRFPADFCGAAAEFDLADDGSALGIPAVRYTRAPDSLDLRVLFPASACSTETRERLARCFVRILEAALHEPDRPIRAIDLVSESERQALIAAGTGEAVPEILDLIDGFAEQVRLRPDAVAVEFNGEEVSYRDLDRYTNRLARRLRALGVGSGSRVAVAMPRGFGEFMSNLSVLKAGGAFVPVDPAHPIDRVRMILEDAEPQVLIVPSSSPIQDALPDGVPALVLDDPRTEGADTDDGPLGLAVDPEQKAYIIFTSGSTGRPKGVEIPRRGISNFLQSVKKTPGLGSGDRLAAISTTTFDMSELDFFLPLQVGATVVIAERAQALDPVLLRRLLEERRVTVMQATPTTWRMLLDAGWKGHERFKVFTGGEPISPALAKRLLPRCAELWNLYGPTETSVYSTIDRIAETDERITVGRAIENTVVTIRDPEGRLAPTFAIGEICIGGKGVALGYYGRPDLTADKFRIDPTDLTRYYRTGDLGRFLPDGRLECLGRVDFQVKVRGFRIELSDIEAHLRTAAGVSEALVTALRKGEGDPQLVAYWVGSATKEELHAKAKAALPYYMVPSSYVRLEAFPLTTSGKVDRNKLPAPEEAVPADGERGTAPRNDRESMVASIWREVLGLSFVPIDEDFFSLGGTSIRAIQMRGKLEAAFGVEVSIKTIFDYPTIADLVEHIGDVEEVDQPIVSRLSNGADPIPWFGLLGIQLFDDLAEALGGDYTTFAIHVPIRYTPGIDAFPTVREIAEKYVRAIRERQPRGPYYLFGLCHGGIVAFEAAAQLEEAGETVGLVALFDAELPRARRTRWDILLAYAIKMFKENPGATIGKIAAKIAKKRGRIPAEDTKFEARPVALAADEAGIDADLAAYQTLDRRVRCGLLTFRATASDTVAPWSRVAPDLGWTGRARSVESFDMPSSHLGIVRPPFAAQVALRMKEARDRQKRTKDNE